MITWARALERLRRYLRDPAGNIWSEEYLRKTWVDVQADLQRRTGILEDVRTISVPPRFGWAYTHEWEHGHTGDPDSAYQAFYCQGGYVTVTAIWETEHFGGLQAGETDPGHHVSFPWEAWMAQSDVGRPARFPFPHDFDSVRAMYYDRQPLEHLSRKRVASMDPTWHKRSGLPQAYWRDDDVSNDFTVWPRPSTASWVDTDGEGMVTSIADDTVGAEIGAIIQSTDRDVLEDEGVTIDVVDTDDAILLVMDVHPREPESLGTILSWPDYLSRYVRFGVLARAYGANTDGRIPSLAQLWQQRYEVGVDDVERFQIKRRQDRDYRMVTQGAPGRRTRMRHPRLPDGYPAV